MCFKFPYQIALILLLAISSCSFLSKNSPKPHVVYERNDLKNQVQYLVIFPVSDFSGKSDNNTKSLDISIQSGFANIYGSKNTIPGAGIIVKELADLMNKEVYKTFISTLDSVSAIEQLVENPKFKNFISKSMDKLSKSTGGKSDVHFALALLSGGEANYDSGESVYLHLGLFDVKALTWKLITKIEINKNNSLVGNWKVDSGLAIQNSFKFFKETNK